MTTIVMFRGQQCWLNSGYQIQLVDPNNPVNLDEIYFELVAVESASVKGRYRGSFVGVGQFVFLPSSIDFENSEWSQGAANGHS